MMDSFETSVVILCVIAIMATAAMFFRRTVAETVQHLEEAGSNGLI
jgi:hypothetical protein